MDRRVPPRGIEDSAPEDGLEATPVAEELVDTARSVTPPPAERFEEPRRKFNTRGRTLREHAARGTLINTAFMIGLSLLGLARGFVLAAVLTTEDYGLWGLLAVSMGTLLWLKQVGIGDKYIQQDEADQEVAFQKAFTLELIFGAITIVVLGLSLPIFAAVYDEWRLVAPGLVCLLALAVSTLQTPIWIFYRRMEFVRQRSLQAIDPVVGLLVSLGFAIAGFGYWSMAFGLVAGATASAIAAVVKSPYPLKLRYDGETLRSYWSFSLPLFIQGGSSVVIAQSAVFAVQGRLGLAAVGAVNLATTITAFTQRVDSLVTGTLYPAICAVKDRTELLYESFVKSNRLALMWAVPFGTALALFGADLIHYALGDKWSPALELLQVTGIVAAVGHIGFNWDAYFRARGETKPMAVASVAAMATFLAAGLPLLFAFGLRGLAYGIACQAAAHIACRAFYLRRLFHGFGFLRHALRAVLPTIPAVGAVLLLRVAEQGGRSFTDALLELSLYGLVTVVATWYFESGLLREAFGYLRRRQVASAAAG
jgi:O-antigen/teichoic acid export membrane protein